MVSEAESLVNLGLKTMPRNSSGTYSLPAGNPVITATVISSAWANSTMTDLKNAMTDSLSRSGQGGMSAGLPLFAGTIGAPGLSWGLELTSGFYRAGAADFRWAIAGVDVFNIASSGVSSLLFTAASSGPGYRLNETDAAANNRIWDTVANSEQLQFRVVNDALSLATVWLSVDRTLNVVDSIQLLAPTTVTGSLTGTNVRSGSLTNTMFLNTTGTTMLTWQSSAAAADQKRWYMYSTTAGTLTLAAASDNEATDSNIMTVARSGTTVTITNFPVGVLQYGGLEVGYRNFRQRRDVTVSGNVADTDRGGMIRFTGGAGQTLTFVASSIVVDGIISITNDGTADVTLAGSGATIQWLNGGGAGPVSGSRILTRGGVMTLWIISASVGWVWGTGIS